MSGDKHRGTPKVVIWCGSENMYDENEHHTRTGATRHTAAFPKGPFSARAAHIYDASEHRARTGAPTYSRISCLPLLGLSSPPVPLQLKLLEELPVLQYHWYWHCWYDISARPQTVYQLLISTADKLAHLGPSTHLESTTSSPRLHLELTNLKHANHRRHPYGVLGSGRLCVVCVQH